MIRIISNNKSYIKYKLPISNYYLIKWKPKSNTDIHNHDGKNCRFILFNGTLQEIRYKNNRISSLYESNKINPLIINTINDNDGYHQIYNFDNKIKWSLHNYY